MALTYKQRLFVAYYLGESQGNATDAARRAGYGKGAEVRGAELVKNRNVRDAIDAHLNEVALTANEILARLSDHATSSVGDLVKVCGKGITFDLKSAKQTGKLRLAKKLKKTKFGWEVELYDAQAALIQLGKYRGLWTDQGDRAPHDARGAHTIDDDPDAAEPPPGGPAALGEPDPGHTAT